MNRMFSRRVQIILHTLTVRCLLHRSQHTTTHTHTLMEGKDPLLPSPSVMADTSASADALAAPPKTKLPPDVFIDEEDLPDEQGETVSIPLTKLGLLDIYLTDLQPFSNVEYHPHFEGRLSREEFAEIITNLNQVHQNSYVHVYFFSINGGRVWLDPHTQRLSKWKLRAQLWSLFHRR